ncbi:type VI secretion system protein TssA [Rhizobium laguerreae]|uniref:type VI secretion system protein TssA n=1 Tax=Rhizobium laguerreae TaxID=1076926 RepID=UPI001C92774B|nr:type VI secretion system ImpA family N-terminal domain-containing protein [Rhizobium laguerreae]MBY3347979.1 hypothetical protein [Rhizobium laguerreae]MBY3354942.1 hypothetical protein [Rhizobium laguerreae]MBY3376247.1 hypothetical protein [Rhizobium laguerreae]MBY3431246.1 hypothetical protein [Rhizobium laguerreae]MBY3439862.1 hypothetical protein [Rhizobium laguerreae]
MRFEDLLSPISDDEPCGPDLDAAGDSNYFAYTMSAEERFPRIVIDPATGSFYDRNVIKLVDEERQSDLLLRRSKDLRLIILTAQFQIGAGEIGRFADTLDAIFVVIRDFWTDIHPRAEDGDLTLRRVALEGLDDRKRVVLPLSYAPLFEDRRLGPVSLRTWRVSLRPEIAKSSDIQHSSVLICDAIGAPANHDAIVAVYANIQKASNRLANIRLKFFEAERIEYAPVFDGIMAVLAEIADMLSQNAPNLAGLNSDNSLASDECMQSAVPSDAVLSHRVAGAAASEICPISFTSMREVNGTLAALEIYFTVFEPSSPALLLVRQARLLIGRPLVEALSVLVPNHSNSVVLKIDHNSGFELDLARMQELTNGILQGGDSGDASESPLTTKEISKRDEAFFAMQGVETFLNMREPSSPVPLLLARGRELMTRDFSSILTELLGGQIKTGNDVS